MCSNALLGTPVENAPYDISLVGNTTARVNIASMLNVICNSGSPLDTTYQNYLYATSEIRFQNINSNANDCRIYKPEGTLLTTGTGLTDTLTRTAGTYSLKLACIGTTIYNSNDTLNKTFTKAVKANSTVVWYGYMRKNSSYGATLLPKVTLTSKDGNINTSATLSNVDDTWELFSIAGSVGASDTFITLKLEAPANASGGACYFADMQLVIGNITTGVATGFKVGTLWKDAEPTADETLGGTVDATFLENAVWNSLTASHTTADTFGKQASDTKQLTDDNQALILTK
jgi:hypothetical protein